VLSLSEQTSHSLGVNPRPFRLVIIIIATLPVTAVISVSGIVQWLGLIIPHLSRKVFGADNRYTLPGSLLMGGLFGLLCDNFSRVPFSGEIPLGIIVSFSGALLFLIILTRKERVHE
jgi:iron complex transport system permease protein